MMGRAHAYKAVYCPFADYTANAAIRANFSSTLGGVTVIGTCATGYYGEPQLTCGTNGVWNTSSILNACTGAFMPMSSLFVRFTRL